MLVSADIASTFGLLSHKDDRGDSRYKKQDQTGVGHDATLKPRNETANSELEVNRTEGKELYIYFFFHILL